MRRPRCLSPEESELWTRVARTVRPLGGKVPPRDGEVAARSADGGDSQPDATPQTLRRVESPLHQPAAGPPPRAGEEKRPLDRHGLDASWDRKLARAALHPDFTLDLHGHTLDTAYLRLEHGIAQALAQGARLLLVITGRPRPADTADRGQRRGAIRAKLLDWLAAGPHAHRIAAVRTAHPKHGGAGAVYVVLKRGR